MRERRLAMKCPACNKDFKTYGGFRRHLAKEAFNYRQRLGFWDEYREACNSGYKGREDDYAWGRVAGLLDRLGRERA